MRRLLCQMLWDPCSYTPAGGGLQLQKWRQGYSCVVTVQNFLRKLQLATSFLLFPPPLFSSTFVAIWSTYLHRGRCLTQLLCSLPSCAGRTKATMLLPRKGGQRGPETICIPLHGKAESLSTRRNVVQIILGQPDTLADWDGGHEQRSLNFPGHARELLPH